MLRNGPQVFTGLRTFLVPNMVALLCLQVIFLLHESDHDHPVQPSLWHQFLTTNQPHCLWILSSTMYPPHMSPNPPRPVGPRAFQCTVWSSPTWNAFFFFFLLVSLTNPIPQCLLKNSLLLEETPVPEKERYRVKHNKYLVEICEWILYLKKKIILWCLLNSSDLQV